MDTLLKLTTIATLAVSLQVGTAGVASATPSTQSSHPDSAWGRPSTDASSLFGRCMDYEPPPNGNPKSDGTGTR